MQREQVTSDTPWEEAVGYSRAVKIGDRVLVSGTTASGPDGEVLAPEDPYRQAIAAMDKVVTALEQAGASAADVVRTRMYVTDIEDWEAIGRAHADIFGEAAPATTMVEVARLVDERMLIEIEAEAIVEG